MKKLQLLLSFFIFFTGAIQPVCLYGKNFTIEKYKAKLNAVYQEDTQKAPTKNTQPIWLAKVLLPVLCATGGLFIAVRLNSLLSQNHQEDLEDDTKPTKPNPSDNSNLKPNKNDKKADKLVKIDTHWHNSSLSATPQSASNTAPVSGKRAKRREQITQDFLELLKKETSASENQATAEKELTKDENDIEMLDKISQNPTNAQQTQLLKEVAFLASLPETPNVWLTPNEDKTETTEKDKAVVEENVNLNGEELSQVELLQKEQNQASEKTTPAASKKTKQDKKSKAAKLPPVDNNEPIFIPENLPLPNLPLPPFVPETKKERKNKKEKNKKSVEKGKNNAPLATLDEAQALVPEIPAAPAPPPLPSNFQDQEQAPKVELYDTNNPEEIDLPPSNSGSTKKPKVQRKNNGVRFAPTELLSEIEQNGFKKEFTQGEITCRMKEKKEQSVIGSLESLAKKIESRRRAIDKTEEEENKKNDEGWE